MFVWLGENSPILNHLYVCSCSAELDEDGDHEDCEKGNVAENIRAGLVEHGVHAVHDLIDKLFWLLEPAIQLTYRCLLLLHLVAYVLRQILYLTHRVGQRIQLFIVIFPVFLRHKVSSSRLLVNLIVIFLMLVKCSILFFGGSWWRYCGISHRFFAAIAIELIMASFGTSVHIFFLFIIWLKNWIYWKFWEK